MRVINVRVAYEFDMPNGQVLRLEGIDEDVAKVIDEAFQSLKKKPMSQSAIAGNIGAGLDIEAIVRRVELYHGIGQ
jgi:hypothetical protein